MPSYHVCGIGNALLDIDIEVSEDTLARVNVERGQMTLIDAERERILLEELDGIKHIKACGGSAANSMMMIRQLGGKVFYSCKIANDDAGDYYYADLVRAGVDTNLCPTGREDGITGKCIAMITPDADRTMNTYLGITEHFSVKELNVDAIAQSEYLYIEGYLVASPTAYEAALLAAKTARANGTKIAITLSDISMIKFFKDNLLAIIAEGVDLLFCNEDEALAFADTTDIKIAEKHLKAITKQYAVTQGEKGALLFDGDTHTAIEAYGNAAIDTIGAGDVFAGGFLYALTHGEDFVAAGDLASFAASKVIAKFGPRLNDEEIKSIQHHAHNQVPA